MCNVLLLIFFGPVRGKDELELDFKRFWEEFRSSSSEKVTSSLVCFFFAFFLCEYCSFWVVYILCYLLLDYAKQDLSASELWFVVYMQEKEVALNISVDAFCKLVKQHANVAQLVTMYLFSFSIHIFLTVYAVFF